MKWGPILAVMVSGALFGLSVPFSKVLVGDIPPVTLAGLLYLGAFLGLFTWMLMRIQNGSAMKEKPLRKQDAPYLAGAYLAGGVLAPILLMVGLQRATGSSASLLLNLEAVATAILAVFFFKEKAGARLWGALLLMTFASFVLSYQPGGELGGDGSIFIILAMVCWSVDNNLMQKVSDHDPVRMALYKSIVAGSVSLTLAFLFFGGIPMTEDSFYAVIIGIVCYGLSMALFLIGLRSLGSCRSVAFFSIGPYVAAIAAVPLLGEPIEASLIMAGVLMAGGTWLIVKEGHEHEHLHEQVHHEHLHSHDDVSHRHHDEVECEHSHEHFHEAVVHTHVHWPDSSHGHDHEDVCEVDEDKRSRGT